MTCSLILGFAYCPSDPVVSIRDLEILGYVHSGVNTCDLPLLWVWLWWVVGRPRIGQGKLPRKIERAITSLSPGFMGPTLIAGSVGRSLSSHANHITTASVLPLEASLRPLLVPS